jgi:RNA polymerase sigma-70 factor (ECF subfamily)
LLRLRHAENDGAWQEFVDIYTPLVYGFCRGRGLQDADAADVAQETMRAVARSMATFEYDPQRGRFRNWLLTVVRSKLNNFLAKQRHQPDPAGPSTLQFKIDGTTTPAEQSGWDAEYHWRLLHWAADRVRGEFQENTWRAFWQTAIEQKDSKAVAQELGMGVGAIYVAKSRVIARLRREIQLVDEDTLTAGIV